MRIVLLGIVVLLAVVAADEAHHKKHGCMPPLKWQAQFWASAFFDGCISKMNYGTVTADLPKHRLKVDYSKFRVQDDSHVNGTVLYYFDQGIGYHYNRTGGVCKPFKVPKTPHPHIPPNAKYLGQFLVGSQSLDAWNIDLSENTSYASHHEKVGVMVTVTRGTCFPVDISYVNMTSNHHVFYSQSFWNVVPSVPAYSFEVPELCKDSLWKAPLFGYAQDVDEKDFHMFGPMAVYDV